MTYVCECGGLLDEKTLNEEVIYVCDSCPNEYGEPPFNQK